MTQTGRARGRPRGNVEKLANGLLRVRVYAGLDPVSGTQHYLREVIKQGPKAEVEAQKALRRLATQVDERRNPARRRPSASCSTATSRR
jgi:hypothetical protein